VVVERRLAAHHQLTTPLTQRTVRSRLLGVPVHRGAAVGSRPGLDVVPWPSPARRARSANRVRLPGRFQDQAARKVAPRRGTVTPYGPRRKCLRCDPGSRRTRSASPPWHAHPLDRTRRRDQAAVLAIGQERIVRDRRNGFRNGCPSRRDGAVTVYGASEATSAVPVSSGSVCCRTMSHIIDRAGTRRLLVPVTGAPTRCHSRPNRGLHHHSGQDVVHQPGRGRQQRRRGVAEQPTRSYETGFSSSEYVTHPRRPNEGDKFTPFQ